jgi:hypothetical protein
MQYSEKYLLTLKGTAPNGGKTNIVTEFEDPDEALDQFAIKSNALRSGYTVTLDRVMTVRIASAIQA